jgi:hypothetical protein
MKPRWKKWIPIGAVLTLYFGGFVILWLGGGYVLSASGKNRVIGGFPLPDRAEWQPLFGRCQPEYQWPGPNEDWSGGGTRPRCDLLGWMYYPLWLAVKQRNPDVEFVDSSRRLRPEIEVSAGFHIHASRGKSLQESVEVVKTAAGIRLKLRPDS